MKHLYFIFLLLIIGTSRAKGIKIVDPATPGQKLFYGNPKDNTLNVAVEFMTDGAKINSNEISHKDDYLRINIRLSITQQGQSTVVGGWDLSQAYLRLNFSQIQQPFDVKVDLREYGATSYYQDPSGKRRQYNLASTNLSPIIDLRSLIDTTAGNTGGFNFSNVSYLQVGFNTCNADTFRLKSMELISAGEISTVMDVVNPVIIDPPKIDPPKIDPPKTVTNSSSIASASYVPVQSIIDSGIDKDQDSTEISTDQAVPEPFSILTMGAGLTAFIRKKKQKRQK